ncbi:MAG: hypothetical protein JXQ73_23375 [Phycisphaerae bacterium]|nr:hypothetical protein [Phycisphaerae bacterium]
MSADRPVKRKTCRICGEDCAGRPRVKDSFGRYYHRECFDQAKQEILETGALAEDAHRAPPPPEAPPEVPPAPPDETGQEQSLLDLVPEGDTYQGLRACESCGAPMASEAALCTNCGFNTRTGTHIDIGRAEIHKDPHREPEVSFWEDAAWSFIFFVRGSNLAALVAVVFVQLIILGLGFVPLFGFVVFCIQLIFAGWLCAFYFHIVGETAGGEDEISVPGFSDWMEDIIRPLFRFIGCGVIALGPAGFFAVILLAKSEDPSMTGPAVLAAIGMFFWPALILGAAIGNALPVRTLPLVLRTALGTPLPYLAVCLFVGVAGLVLYMSTTGLADMILKVFGQEIPTSILIAMAVVAKIVEAYTTIVAMRQIGLFYRHYKARFPWAAE